MCVSVCVCVCLCVCVWRVFSHYKLPLLAQSPADPRKFQANMLSDQWRQTANDPWSAAARHVRWLMHSLHPRAASNRFLRAVKLHYKAGKANLLTYNLTWMQKITIQPSCALNYTLSPTVLTAADFSFFNFQAQWHATFYAEWEEVIFGVCQWLKTVTFLSRSAVSGDHLPRAPGFLWYDL